MTAQNKKLFLTLALASIFYFLSSATVFAQNTSSFTVSPPSLDFSLKPGQKVERTIKVTNTSQEKMDFTVNIEDFVVTDNKGTPELLAPGVLPNNRFAASSWSVAIPDSFSIEPGKSQTTVIYINVPKDANPGGRYFAAAVRSVNDSTLTSTGAKVNTVVGCLIRLKVDGVIKENARLVSFLAPIFSEYGPVPFTTEIRNFGDIHASPRATVEVKDLFGRKVYSFALDNLNIFPGTARIYKNSLEIKWLLGRFTAKLEGYYGTGNKLPLSANLAFWVIPYKLIIAVLLAVAISIIVYSYFKKKQEAKEIIEEEK